MEIESITSHQFLSKRDIIEEDQEIEIEDNESVLELADKVIAKIAVHLAGIWSRHQSLINFSNYYFYENRLLFASQVGSEVKYVKVGILYIGGVNLPEVEQTIQTYSRSVMSP